MVTTLILRNIRFILLPLLSAALYFFSYPDFSFWPLSFVAISPLLYEIKKTNTFSGCVRLSLVWSIFFYIALGFFLKNAVIDHYGFSRPVFAGFFLFGLVLPHAAIFLFFCAGAVFLRPKGPAGAAGFIFEIFAVPALWILHEYIKEIIPPAIPWGFIGYAPAGFSAYMQAADLGGVYLISFVTVSINSSIAAFFSQGGLKSGSVMERLRSALILRYIVSALILFLATISYGYFRSSNIENKIKWMTAENRSISAKAVQAGHTNRDRWDQSRQFMVVSDYVALSGFDKTIPSITVWPETVINSSAGVTENIFSALTPLINERSILVAGGARRDNALGGVYNSAYFLSGDKILRWYDKIILLPFSETAPFGAGFGSFYSAPSEFSPGKKGQTIKTPFGTAGAGICFEAIYPSHARDAAVFGAEFLLNISNDSWFGEHSQPMIHLIAASVRCIENRRYMVRASNSGHSAVIDPLGRYKMTALNERGSVSGKIIPMNELTIYSRFGGWIIIMALCIVAAFGIRGMFADKNR